MKVKIINVLLLVILLLASYTLNAQSKKGESLAKTAQQFADEGNFQEAVKYYNKAVKSDPAHMPYKFGLSMAYYRLEKYEQSIKYAEEIRATEKADIDTYRLLANSYDIAGKYKKALEVLEEGIEKFPYEGDLYFDWGIIEMLRSAPEKALLLWEKGMNAEPTLPDNYFVAAKVYGDSNEKTWALIYGEIFMNLERGTERSDEIAEMLYRLYLDMMEDPKSLVEGDIKLSRELDNPFYNANMRVFTMLKENNLTTLDRGAMLSGENNKMKAIAMARKSFLETWLQGFTLAYEAPLYKYQSDLYALTFFESYNFWLFSKANPNEFMQWMQKNSAKYEVFINWFLENPIKIDLEQYMERSRYEAHPKKTAEELLKEYKAKKKAKNKK